MEKFCIGYSLKQLKKSKKKPVVNSNGEWFESAKKASEIYNVSSSAIVNSIKHPKRDEKWKCSGVYWSFQEERKNDQILWWKYKKMSCKCRRITRRKLRGQKRFLRGGAR